MYNTILFTILFLILPLSGYSQFYTIKKEIQQKSIEYYDTDSYEDRKRSPLKPKGKEEPIRAKTKDSKDTLQSALCTKKVDESTSPKETKKKYYKRKAKYPKKAPMKSATPLPHPINDTQSLSRASQEPNQVPPYRIGASHTRNRLVSFFVMPRAS